MCTPLLAYRPRLSDMLVLPLLSARKPGPVVPPMTGPGFVLRHFRTSLAHVKV